MDCSSTYRKSRAVRVLIVTHHSLEREAPQVRYLAEFLSRNKCAVELLGPISPKFVPSDVRIVRVGNGRMRNVGLFVRGLWRCVTHNYDIVIGVDEPGAAVAIGSKYFGRKNRVAIYFLDIFIDARGSRIKRLGQWLLRRRTGAVDAIIDTNEERSVCRQGFLGHGPAYAVMHNAAPLSPEPSRASLHGSAPVRPPDGTVRLLYTGVVSLVACLDRLIVALSGVKGDVQLDIVGWGPDEEVARLRTLATDCNCSHRVNFVGPVPREELSAITRRSDIGIALYRNTSEAGLNWLLCSPNKVYEYIAAGLPVITCDSPTMRSLVEGNGCGLCVSSEDHVAIGRTLERLVGSNDLRASMSAQSLELHKSRMNFEWQAEQILGLLKMGECESTPGK